MNLSMDTFIFLRKSSRIPGGYIGLKLTKNCTPSGVLTTSDWLNYYPPFWLGRIRPPFGLKRKPHKNKHKNGFDK